MKLQSQETKKFDSRELQRLARRTRPWSWKDVIPWALAGLVLGAVIVGVVYYVRHLPA